MTTAWAVDPTRRHLLRDGEPWFLLGDTAWELLHRLPFADAAHYLHTRADQGFNTVLTVALAEFDGLSEPNADGELPFHDDDPRRPNDRYWAHVDRVVGEANGCGLTVGLLPTWGSWWADGERPFFDAATAYEYARFVARRYAAREVVWVLGGDREIRTPEHRTVVDAFAAGVRDVVGNGQLVTFHPRGHGSSSDVLADADWLDFDLVQSGHLGWATPNHQLIEQDYRRNARPIMDGEPNYENHPVMAPGRGGAPWTPVAGWRFDDRDVRRAAYHALLAGACGHVYGCHDVWQFYDPTQRPAINEANLPWQQAIHLPGAEQLRHVAALAAEISFTHWAPAQDVIRQATGFLGGSQRAMARTDPPGVLVYAPGGRQIRLDLSRWPSQTWSARWWDPRHGGWTTGPDVAGAGPDVAHAFEGEDGVLLLEPR